MSKPLPDDVLHEWRRSAEAARTIVQDWIVRVDDVLELLDEVDRLRAALRETEPQKPTKGTTRCDHGYELGR